LEVSVAEKGKKIKNLNFREGGGKKVRLHRGRYFNRRTRATGKNHYRCQENKSPEKQDETVMPPLQCRKREPMIPEGKRTMGRNQQERKGRRSQKRKW